MSLPLRFLSKELLTCCTRNITTSLKAIAIALLISLGSTSGTYAQQLCMVDITCPPDVTVECGANIDDFDLTGYPEAAITGDCGGDLVVTKSDVVTFQDGSCLAVILRTWTASSDGVSEQCTQTITVADTEGPVFVNPPANATYECLSDVPPAGLLEVTDCDQLTDIVVFEPNDVDSLFCTLTTPVGPGPDWSVWLNGLAGMGLASGDYYNWVPGSATMSYHVDGTAYLTGSVANMNNPAETWTVHFWMENGRNWNNWSALGRSYKDDLGFGAAHYQNWTYYELVPVFSHFVGTGANAGNSLYLSHQPANYYFGFQFGVGANNRNGNDGGSGWFYYNGWVNGEYVSNHGDLTTDKDCETVLIPNLACESHLTRIWSASDECGNVSFHEQSITIDDNTAPTFSSCPEDVTVQCNEAIPAAVSVESLSASDNCNGPVTISYSGSTEEVISACAYDIVHTYEAADTCDNRSFCVYRVHVVDTTPPVLIIPADATVECNTDFVWSDASATDACHQDQVEITYGQPEFHEDDCYGYYTRTVTAHDGCDNYAQGVQTIDIDDTTDPVFAAYEVNLYVECDEVDGVAILTATDNCDETVTVEFTEITNSGGCLGVIMRTYTATDDCGNSAEAVQYIHIQDTTPPTIDEPADATYECNQVPVAPGAGGAEIWDNCGYEVEVEFHTEIVDGPCANSYTILWIWEATDYCENFSTDTTVITIVDTTDPVLTVPQGGTFSCDEDIIYGSASAEDNCDTDVTIEFSDVQTPGECPQEYMVVRTWTATDNCGNSSEASATYYVVDNDAPVFTSVPQNITIECGDDVPVTTATAEDNCGAVTITSSDAYQQQTTCYTLIIRTFTAEDECGNSETASHTITIVDTTPPVITYEPEITRPCDDYMGIYATGDDICSGETEVFIVGDEHVSGSCAGRIIRTYGSYDECENYSQIQQIINLIDQVDPYVVEESADQTIECGDALPSVYTIFDDNCDTELTITSDTTSEVIDCATYYYFTWTATDDCNNSVSNTVVVISEDTTNPYFTDLPADITINCYEAVPAIVVPTAGDICDDVVDVEVTDDTLAGVCPNEFTVARVYRAYDDCGNQVVETRYIYVVDNDAPVFGEQQYLFSYECDEVIPVIEPAVSDLCGAVTLDYDDFWFEESDCFGYLSRIWTATDECGNQSDFAQFINIYDETDPIISGEIEIEMPCDEISNEILVTATDNCDEVVDIVIWSDEIVSGACAGRLMRVYRAYDECGNWSEFTQFITLIDNEAPEASYEPVDATYECPTDWYVVPVTFEDNCDDEMILTANVTQETDGCTTVYHYIWTAIDHCENTTVVDLDITVTDTTPPVANVYPEDFTVECGQAYDIIVPTFTDLCDLTPTVEEDVNEVIVGCYTEITYSWTATDDCDNSTTVEYTVTIEDTTPPVLTVPAGNEYSCSDEWEIGAASAYDVCDGVIEVTYTDSIIAGECPQEYSIVRTWVAVDGCQNFAAESSTYYVYDNELPYFTSVPDDVTIECNTAIPASNATAGDLCDTDVEVTQYDMTEISSDCYTMIVRTFVATDDCGNQETANQYIYIVDTTDPEINGEVQITMPCDDISTEILVTATDNCDDDVEIYILSDIYNSGSCAGVIERTYIAWDNCENSTTFVQFITLTDDEAPTPSIDPVDLTVECGDEWVAAVVGFIDNCDDFISVAIDTVMTETNCETVYHYTWTATDHCDNVTVVDQYITIEDTTAPVIDDQNTEVTVPCNLIVDYFLPPAAYDACDGVIEVVAGGDYIEGDCPGEHTEIVTYTATDACGNSSMVSHIVHYVDEDAPELANIPQGGSYECDDELPNDAPTAYDYCSDATVYSSADTLEGSCPNNYAVIRSFWAVDECGNISDTVTVTYNVSDETNPWFTSEVSDEYYECIDWETYEVQSVSAADNCGPATVDHYIEAEWVDNCGNGEWVVYYEATDLCDNVSYLQYTIYVQDETAPVLSSLPADMMLDCGDELPEAPVITATDNCDDVTVTMTEVCLGDCPEDGEAECDLITPVRPANNPCNYPVDWAMALFGMPSSHKWYQLVPGTGTFTDNGDGSVTITGTLVNAYNSNGGFTFNVTFANGLDWSDWSSQAFPTGFKADCGGEAANHTAWMYYILQAAEGAELIGWGTYDGSLINLTHAPANLYFGFQYGDGANNYNGENGFGGWFGYNGVFLVDDEPIMSGNAAGAGDFAFEVDCCPDYSIERCWTSTDCSGNSVSWCQTITFGDLDTDFGPAAPQVTEVEAEKGDLAIVSVMPNPASNKAQISFFSNEGGKMTLQVLDMTGRVIADLYNGVVESGIVYKADFDADRVPSGIYMIRLNSENAQDIERIQITK